MREEWDLGDLLYVVDALDLIGAAEERYSEWAEREARRKSRR